MNGNMDLVEHIIGYRFNDRSVLMEALHAAGARPWDTQGRNYAEGNKRLALVGDKIMPVALLKALYPTLVNPGWLACPRLVASCILD